MQTNEIIRFFASRAASSAAGALTFFGIATEHSEPFVYAGVLVLVDAAFALRRWLTARKIS